MPAPWAEPTTWLKPCSSDHCVTLGRLVTSLCFDQLSFTHESTHVNGSKGSQGPLTTQPSPLGTGSSTRPGVPAWAVGPSRGPVLRQGPGGPHAGTSGRASHVARPGLPALPTLLGWLRMCRWAHPPFSKRTVSGTLRHQGAGVSLGLWGRLLCWPDMEGRPSSPLGNGRHTAPANRQQDHVSGHWALETSRWLPTLPE